ncbi:hypothetical protein [Qipengyuania seohaensis]|uniref:hypothetical protein n=1 Tax=Qipengyuania seohaensis TaxID=266951 RepID=UPI0012FD4E3B|nr:hypothetical protein [Qipengyuania seohaensis]
MKLSNDSSAYLCHLRCTKKAEGRWEPCDKDPSSWLYLNPQPVTEGTSFGVLRKTFWGRVNSGHEFGWRKTHLGPDFAGSDQSVWAPNAERVEVVLPAKADDLLSDPCELLRQTDKFAAPNKQALLTYWTMPLGTAERLHIAWECVRSFARLIACERDLGSIVALHSPGVIGADFPLHAHLLIVPRKLGWGIKHGPYDQTLIRDDGQEILGRLWASHRNGEGIS